MYFISRLRAKLLLVILLILLLSISLLGHNKTYSTSSLANQGGIIVYVPPNCSPATIMIQTGTALIAQGQTDASGKYDTCYTLQPGRYRVTASKTGCTFYPPYIDVDVVAESKVEIHFESCECEEIPEEGLDFGDAPEGVLAYPSKGVIGNFPTCKGVGPGKWIQHGLGWARFGHGWDSENDGNGGLCPIFAPYDNDECFKDGDSGLLYPEPFTIIGGQVVPCPNSNGTPLGKVCQTAVWGKDIDIIVKNNMPVDGYVNVLMDWNQNGSWGGHSACPGQISPIPEHVLVNFRIPKGYSGFLSGLNPPPFSIGPTPGYVWARFTISERPVPVDWNGSGAFEDGETEDYLLLIGQGVTETMDFGDAPDPSYPTLLKNNGARHIITPNILLGTKIDSENDGQPNANATGDDVLDGNNDEDGVTFTTSLIPGGVAGVKIIASARGFIDAWIDFNIDGDWLDTNEQIFISTPVSAGVNNLNFNVPSSAKAGKTFARFRFSTTGGLSPTGLATDGEVEDYMVEIEKKNPGGIIVKIYDSHDEENKTKPCPNIPITISGPLPSTSIVITGKTDENGVFDTCYTLVPGIYKVKPGINCSPDLKTVMVSSGKKSEVYFVCSCFGGVTGYIGCDYGPCKNVSVLIYDESGEIVWETKTNDEGVFDTCYNILPGTYTVRPVSEKCNFTPSEQKIEIEACHKTYIKFKCDCCRECQLGGIIAIFKKECIPDEVKIYDEKGVEVTGSWSRKPNQEGVFDTCKNLNPGKYKVVPFKENCKYIPEYQWVAVKPCEKTRIEFDCECEECKKGGIKGKVVCYKDSSIFVGCKDVKILIFDSSGNLVWEGLTDDNGEFDTCKSLEPGNYKVVAKSPRDSCKISPEVRDVVVKACEKKEITFECNCCKEKGGIEGSVIDSDTGNGCKNATVVVLGPLPSKEIAWYGKTDENGKYSTCLTLIPGDYEVYVKLKCETESKKVTVTAGTHVTVNFKCRCVEKSVPLWLNPPYEEVEVKEGYTFKKAVEIGKPGEPITNLMAAKFYVEFDPKLIKVSKVIEGGFLKQGGASTVFLYTIDNFTGKVVINTSRLGGTGASGFGTLAVIYFSVTPSASISTTTEVKLPLGYSDLRDTSGDPIAHYTENETVKFVEKVKLVGDFNEDGKIDFEDLVIFSLAFGHKKGDKGWDKKESNIPGSPFNRCDIWDSSPTGLAPVTQKKPDGAVDFNDLMVFIINWNFYKPEGG
ncbi:MAG: hypothetical protein DRI28_02510 [Caldiserica bacterium]|nr:MAG: hypothetical protein DRI28_02510 [Caldisericota bacterium]